MTRATVTAEPAAGPPRSLSLFERTLFFVLLAVLGARPLISESFERVELSFLTALGAGGGVTPAATAWLDSLTLTASAAALVRAWSRRNAPRWLVVGVVLLAAAVTLSTAAASNQRTALTAGFSLLVGVLSGAALVFLMRAAWMPRLLLATLLASGSATAAKCLVQKAYEFSDTLAYWNENKDRLTPAGFDSDDPTIVNFERRLRSGEAFGYQAHPNVTGSLLMMWVLAAAGLLVGGLLSHNGPTRAERVAAVVLVAMMLALLAFGLWTTGSAGAFIAAAGGALLLLLLGRWRRAIASHAGRATALLAAGYLALITGALGYGLTRGTLPHPSLAFRWHYWTAAAQAFLDAPLTGLGRGNFAAAYLLHKPVASTEDVRDPHNLWLALLVELGPLGLGAAGLLTVGCVHGTLRRLACNHAEVPVTRADVLLPARQAYRPAVPARALLVAALGVLVLQALFSGVVLDRNLIVVWAVELAGVWVFTLVLAVYALDRLTTSASARAWLIAGLAAALAAALIHGLIDFALLTPAGLGVFAALTACAYAVYADGRASGAPPAHITPAFVGMLVVAAHLALVTVPVMRAASRLAQMKNAAASATGWESCEAALHLGQAALTSDPLDPGVARDVSRVAAMLATNAALTPDDRVRLLQQAVDSAHVALRRDPRSSAAHARLARLYEELESRYLLAARPDDSVTARSRAVDQWQAAVRLNPTDPRQRIAAGKAWFHWWEETDAPTAAHTAAEHFAAALRIDATRQPEEVMRLRPTELDLVRQRLRTLTDAGFGGPGASGPAP